MNVSHYETVVSHVNGVVAEKPTWLNELNEYRVHAAWKLGQCGTCLLYTSPSPRD